MYLLHNQYCLDSVCIANFAVFKHSRLPHKTFINCYMIAITTKIEESPA